MVVSIGSILEVLDTSPVKVDTTTFVSIKSLMLLPKALIILNNITFAADPLSISTLDISMPLRRLLRKKVLYASSFQQRVSQVSPSEVCILQRILW